ECRLDPVAAPSDLDCGVASTDWLWLRSIVGRFSNAVWSAATRSERRPEGRPPSPAMDRGRRPNRPKCYRLQDRGGTRKWRRKRLKSLETDSEMAPRRRAVACQGG